MVAVVQISILLMRFIMNQGIRTSNPVTLQLLDSILTKNIGMLAFLGFFMCIVAPITEELIFRGLMYPWLRQRWGVAVGIIVSSLLFSAVHLDFPQFLSLLGLGAVLALVFEYTRSLRVTMIMHAMWNAWTVLGALAILPR
jgi:membrane protease YdiL (CAAX protease family)